MPQHTSHEYESELRALKDRLLAMGGRCERLTLQAIRALEHGDEPLAQEVATTDRQINADELAVDDMAVRILALRQPVGRDLRFLLTALKVVTDLERIGDEAVNIAERAGDLARRGGTPDLPYQNSLPEMARIATEMLHTALDAFVEEDADKAITVLLRDDEVDDLYGRTLRETREFIIKDPQQVEVGMQVASCAKYIERIADHATNIAEMVVYFVRGEDVRHKGNR
jgi:phosphate transport system protein